MFFTLLTPSKRSTCKFVEMQLEMGVKKNTKWNEPPNFFFGLVVRLVPFSFGEWACSFDSHLLSVPPPLRSMVFVLFCFLVWQLVWFPFPTEHGGSAVFLWAPWRGIEQEAKPLALCPLPHLLSTWRQAQGIWDLAGRAWIHALSGFPAPLPAMAGGWAGNPRSSCCFIKVFLLATFPELAKGSGYTTEI